MRFSFKLSKDISAIFPLVKDTIRENRGKFDGNEQNGTFEGNGIAGNYTVTESTVTVVISKKPALISDAKIKEAIINYFDGKPKEEYK